MTARAGDAPRGATLTGGGADAGAGAGAGPALDFAVEQASVVAHAAVPTLAFTLRITTAGDTPVQSIVLATQLQIAAAQRPYDEDTRRRLAEVFGQPSQWGKSARRLLWTNAVTIVPSFTGETRVELLVPCTYDFEVVASKYLHGVHGGDIPLELLFSGTIFYASDTGALRVGRIALDREARFRLPASTWHELMARYFPNSAWLRLGTDVFDRLWAYKTRHAAATWDDAVAMLLAAASSGEQ